MILKALPGSILDSNCYIVASEKTGKGLIIDPSANADAIQEIVAELNLSISLMVATHAHIDHICEAARIKHGFNVDLAIHEAEANMEIWSRDWAVKLGLPLEALPNPDRLLRDGDVLETGDLKFTVLHTPGHSPGGISLAGHGMVFTGDVLFRGNIGSTNNYGGNYEELIESVSSLLADFSDEDVVLPGHGRPTTIGTERRRIGLTTVESPSPATHPATTVSKGWKEIWLRLN